MIFFFLPKKKTFLKIGMKNGASYHTTILIHVNVTSYIMVNSLRADPSTLTYREQKYAWTNSM